MKLRRMMRWSALILLGLVVPAALFAIEYDSQNNAKMVDMDRDRGWFVRHTNILQTVLVGGNRDSSFQMPTLGANRLWLRAYGTLDSTVFRAVVAIQIRAHQVDLPDTVAAVPWSRNLWSLGSSSDTVGTATLTVSYASTASTATPDEFLWAIPGQGAVPEGGTPASLAGQAQPRGRWIPLVDRLGNPFTAPFTSIRVRPVAFYDADGTLITLTTRRVAMQFDLVGLR